jgi:hypothetical protein
VLPEPIFEPEPSLDAEPEPELASEAEPEPVSVPMLAASHAQHAAVLMARLAVGLFVLVVLINIPLTSRGVALARSLPNSASLVIRNGLLIKETGSPKIWVYRDGAFHWITSLEAFETLGYRWQNVHVVDAGFLEPFVEGRPVYLLLRCPGSPHYYRFEAGIKRWIVDIPTFLAEGYVWEDLKPVSCAYLRDLPDGDSIPPGHGAPPSRLP